MYKTRAVLHENWAGWFNFNGPGLAISPVENGKSDTVQRCFDQSMKSGSNLRVDKSVGKYLNYKRVKNAFIELAISQVKITFSS